MKKEIEQLKDFIAELDYLLNEGVIITLDEKAEFINLFERGLDIIADFNHINEKGNLQILETEFDRKAQPLINITNMPEDEVQAMFNTNYQKKLKNGLE